MQMIILFFNLNTNIIYFIDRLCSMQENMRKTQKFIFIFQHKDDFNDSMDTFVIKIDCSNDMCFYFSDQFNIGRINY